MAGKKKKSLANKLAKMSDEDRARYLQHRSDIEEEAKRRKEQLIATFLKKKIKKEEAFSRLNLAKINQNWHQILRKAKCREMRNNVEHLKEWIDRIIEYKDNTIKKLLNQLEEAEEDYLTNFRSHSTHIDDILDHQNKYVEKLKLQYDEDLEGLVVCAERENKMLVENADMEEKYLKTILFGHGTKSNRILRKEYEEYMLKCYEAEYNFQSKMNDLKKTREGVSEAIWKQIAATVGQYVAQTDLRRCHLAELKRLDAKSAAEITENEDRIRKEEILIDNFKEEYASMQAAKEGKQIYLELQLQTMNKQFLKIRKSLQWDLQTDEKQMKLLTDVSAKALNQLKSLDQKGQHIINLAETCKKFETERERIIKWMPISSEFLTSGDESPVPSGYSKNLKPDLSVDGLKVSPIDSPDYTDSKPLQIPAAPKSQPRPKTSIPGRVLSPPSAILETPTPEPKTVTTIQNIILQAKNTAESTSSSSSSPALSSHSKLSGKNSENILERCFESLKDLEGFWFTHNKVEVDFIEIREEKKVLERENKQLRGMIRAVLEAVALSKPLTHSKTSTRLPSRRRSAYSAPLRRVIFQ